MKKRGRTNIPREALEHYRFQSIDLRKKGWKIDDIAEAFGVHRCSVSHWHTKAKRYGKKSLKMKKKEARGSPLFF